MYGYIYETTNLINGKKYIGQHRGSFDENYKGSGTLLRRAIKKYGKENFKVKLLEECNNQIHLNEREIYWITKFNASKNDNYYNVSIGGNNFMTLVNHTEETKRKISEANKGKIVSDEIRKKISNTEKGKIVSNETKKRISEANRLRFKDPLERYKCGNSTRGKHISHSKEHNKKVAEALRNKKYIHKDNEIKYVKIKDLDFYISQDWKLGKIDKIIKEKKSMSEIKKGGHWICNIQNKSKYVYSSDLDKYLNQGWKLGRKFK